MNKKLLSLLIIFFICQSSILQAQELQIGLKGGINKTYGGQITGIASTADYTDETFNAEGEIGFHGGLWTQVNFGKFFIRPEIVYSKLESRFDFPQGPALYNVDEVSIPILLGYNIFGPIDIYAGPAYKNVIESTIERLEPIDNPPVVVVQNSPFSAQIGAKVEFGSFGLDVRYDRTLATIEPQGPVDFVSDNANFDIPVLNRAVIDDARLNQIIVSLTIKLFDSENAGKRRRRGGNCYF